MHQIFARRKAVCAGAEINIITLPAFNIAYQCRRIGNIGNHFISVGSIIAYILIAAVWTVIIRIIGNAGIILTYHVTSKRITVPEIDAASAVLRHGKRLILIHHKTGIIITVIALIIGSAILQMS